MAEPSKVLDKSRIKNMSLGIIKLVQEADEMVSTEEGREIVEEVKRMTTLMLTWVYNQSEKRLINQ